MDYTTVAIVKEDMHIAKNTDDAILARKVTAASRTVDKLCARSQQAVNYFQLADVVDELLYGKVDNRGHIICWPHKSIVNSVTAMSYRMGPLESWQVIDATLLMLKGIHAVEAWTVCTARPTDVFVKITYNGGTATSTSQLPEDFVELTTLLAGRYYREAETGMTDAMGIAELGTMTYTKALPQRVKELIKTYQRTVPW